MRETQTLKSLSSYPRLGLLSTVLAAALIMGFLPLLICAGMTASRSGLVVQTAEARNGGSGSQIVAANLSPLTQGQKVVLPKAEPIVASPSQQKEFKLLTEARAKAQTEYDAELTKLPEYVAFNAAKKALEAAAAKVPKTNLDAAQARVLDAAYKVMAELKLSSREYEPTLDKGELVFTKIEPKKPD